MSDLSPKQKAYFNRGWECAQRGGHQGECPKTDEHLEAAWLLGFDMFSEKSF